MTRPKTASVAFANSVQAAVDVVVSPLIKIVPLQPVPTVASDASAIFSSRNGIVVRGNGRRAYCVGERTTDAAKSAGWDAQFAGQDADALVKSLTELRLNEPLVHVRGTHSRGDIASRLRAKGMTVSEAIAYDQQAQTLSAEAVASLQGSTPVIVPLFSPRSAALFASVERGSAPLMLVAISAATGEVMRDFPCDKLEVALDPTAQSVRASVESCAMAVGLG